MTQITKPYSQTEYLAAWHWFCKLVVLQWAPAKPHHAAAGPKNSVGTLGLGCKSSFYFHPSPPMPFLPFFSHPSLFFFPSLPPLEVAAPPIAARGLGERLSYLSGSGQSPAAKRTYVFWRILGLNLRLFEYLMQLTDTLSHNIIVRLVQWGRTNIVLPHWASPSPVATRPTGHKIGFLGLACWWLSRRVAQ